MVINSKQLGLDLESGGEKDYFEWFVACLLFGKPVQQGVAKRAFDELVQHDITSPDAVLDTGYDNLVELLRAGHYSRFDYSTASKLLNTSSTLKEKYGSIGGLLNESSSLEDVSERLQEFKGIGPKTAEIFLRDLGPILERKHSFAG
ncbi:hypothetical protein FQN57_005716 [Myotisia sp. PD_48]|nr:hypothetical protein FQN57_005716 [Myotisia sp. PD_48]